MKSLLISLCWMALLILTACAAGAKPQGSLPSSTTIPTTAPTASPTAHPIALATVTATATAGITATAAAGSSDKPTATPPAQVVFKTAVGELAYVSSRFVEEVNGSRAAEGSRILLVLLQHPDGSDIDLQQFFDAHMQIFIRPDKGADILSTMCGFVGSGFAIGFEVPKTVKTYQLVWGDHPPLEIFPAH